MKLLISPAKKMRDGGDSLPPETVPGLLEKSAQLLDYLRDLSLPELERLLACNDRLASQANEQFHTMDLRRGDTPALLAYDGIQYKYMAPGVFTEKQFHYVKAHLRTLSGLYGVLRPFDGVSPYRLEMQAKVKTSMTFGGIPWGSTFWEKTTPSSTWLLRNTPRRCVPHCRGRRGLSPVCSRKGWSRGSWWKKASM